MELNRHLEAANGLDGIAQHNLFLVNINSQLVPNGLGDFLGGHGAEGSSALSRLDGQSHGGLIQLCSQLPGRCQLLCRNPVVIGLLKL